MMLPSARLLRHSCVLALIASLIASPAFAKRKDDVVVLKNGDRITGEIKKIQHGTLYFKPGYALDSMEIDWARVAQLDSLDRFNVFLTDGTVHSGLIRKILATDDFTITTDKAVLTKLRSEVIRVQPTEDSLWKQTNGSIDYGFSLASDNSQIQSSLGARAEYLGDRNTVAFDLTSNLTSQNDGANTSRNSAAFAYSRRVSENWSAIFLTNLLTSSQQKLDLRTSLGGGVGRILIRTANTRSILSGGLLFSRERYSPETGLDPLSKTTEAWLSLAFTHFRFKVFDLDTRLTAYPNLTTRDRVRVSSDSNVRWEFAKDFYWNLRIYENYDSHPPIVAPKNDFGITTSLGWKF
jgi:putative salt-induced outer membrane protein YdiY